MNGPGRGDAAPIPGGATTTTIAPEGRYQRSAEVDAAQDIRDRATRLALRAAGHGHVQVDDLAELVAATGRLVDIILRGEVVG